MLNLVMKLDKLHKIQEQIENETIDKEILKKYKDTFGLNEEDICDYIRNFHDLYYSFENAYRRFLKEMANFESIKPGATFTDCDGVDKTIEMLDELFKYERE